VDFTREPIIESVITPKEGCKLVVRSSKGLSQEEYFVDALEMVSFGQTFFLRSLERPKSFLLPATDYEVLEVREPRMVLKTALEKSSKAQEKPQNQPQKKSVTPQEERPLDKKKERRRQRKRRDREALEGEAENSLTLNEVIPENVSELDDVIPASVPRSIIPPPTTLISETIARYRGDDLFKGVFFPEEEPVVQAPSDPASDHQEEEQPF
jgi:hypothetical protein